MQAEIDSSIRRDLQPLYRETISFMLAGWKAAMRWRRSQPPPTDLDFDTAVKYVAAHLRLQGKTYMEIAVDPVTNEIATSFEPTANPLKN